MVGWMCVEQVLVKIVKGAQWRKIKGKQGQWDEFVAMVNRKRGGIHSDPAKHPVDVLAAFVQTFTKKEDVEVSVVLNDGIDFAQFALLGFVFRVL